MGYAHDEHGFARRLDAHDFTAVPAGGRPANRNVDAVFAERLARDMVDAEFRIAHDAAQIFTPLPTDRLVVRGENRRRVHQTPLTDTGVNC